MPKWFKNFLSCLMALPKDCDHNDPHCNCPESFQDWNESQK